MLYSEFLTGTGAPDNMIAYTVYSGLNRIYMRHDDYTKEEAYRDGQKILDDLGQVSIVKRLVFKRIYYHGFGNPLTYNCGYCNFSVNEEDEYCRACGAKFYKNVEQAETLAADLNTNNRQEPDIERK